MFPMFRIPTFAKMTIKKLISGKYNLRHTREKGGIQKF